MQNGEKRRPASLVCYPHIGLLYFIVLYEGSISVYLQRRLFLLFYRATALQRGNFFPNCAWRMPLLHRNFSLAFALDFLVFTPFLRQILGKIEPSSLFFLIKFCTLFHSFPTVLYTSHIPVQSPFLHCPFQKINCPNRNI